MNIYYGPYLVETDVSDFITVAYQAAIILRLSTNPRMGWYARNMSELQSPNSTINFKGPIRRLITYQATSWTQQLYKDKYSPAVAQQYHHPHPYTSLLKNTVIDSMKICLFYARSLANHNLYLTGTTNTHQIKYRHLDCTSTSGYTVLICSISPQPRSRPL